MILCFYLSPKLGGKAAVRTNGFAAVAGCKLPLGSIVVGMLV